MYEHIDLKKEKRVLLNKYIEVLYIKLYLKSNLSVSYIYFWCTQCLKVLSLKKKTFYKSAQNIKLKMHRYHKILFRNCFKFLIFFVPATYEVSCGGIN